MDLQLIVTASLSLLFFLIVLSGLIRRKFRDLILPNLDDTYDQVIRLSRDFRMRYGLSPLDRVTIKFLDIKAKRKLQIFKARKDEISHPHIPLQALISIYGDIDSIPDPIVATYKLSYPDYIRRAAAYWFTSFVALMTFYLAMQRSMKLELMNAVIYCSILSSIWTLFNAKSSDWSFGLKDKWISIKIFFQKIVGGKNYVSRAGELPVLITAPHSTSPGGEVLIEYISTEIAKRLNCHLLIGKVSRTILDLNRKKAQSSPFRKKILELIKSEKIVLLIDVHGFSPKPWKPENDIEIGTSNLKTTSTEIRDVFSIIFKDDGMDVGIDNYFTGEYLEGNIINTYGNAKDINALQIEIHRKVRSFKSDKLEKVIDGIVRGVEKALVTLRAQDAASSFEQNPLS